MTSSSPVGPNVAPEAAASDVAAAGAGAAAGEGAGAGAASGVASGAPATSGMARPTAAPEAIVFRRHAAPGAGGGDGGGAGDDAAASDGDRSAGIEYIVLALVVLAAVTYFSERVQRLLQLLYNPFVIFVLVLIFAEYLVLKARDRTFALERELELTRRKRHEAERHVADARATLETVLAAVGDAGDGAGGGADADAARGSEDVDGGGEEEGTGRVEMAEEAAVVADAAAGGDAWAALAREELEALRERLRPPS